MGLRARLGKLQKAMRGDLESFELEDGSRYFFEPQAALRDTFGFFGDCMTADYRREPRPEPPEVLRAVANARDRGEALSRVMGDYSHLPIDRAALVELGRFVPRSLVAGRSYEEPGE